MRTLSTLAGSCGILHVGGRGMTDGIESVGEVVTGGLIARAAEPHAGEGRSHLDGICRNCGTSLIGRHCHECGQPAHVHRTLSAFFHDLLHGVLHFEGKIWRTLPLLAWRPGQLTRRYIEGERARFVSPIALFLFAAFLTFAVFSATGGPVALEDSQTGENFEQSLSRGIERSEREVAAMEKQRAQAVARGESTVQIDAELKERRDGIGLMRLTKERGIAEAGLTRASDDLPAGLKWFEGAYKRAKANPSLLIYKLQNNAYKFSWALIPLSVPFLWLLFPFNRRFRIYDHTVFVTYSLCFMTLLMVTLSLGRAAGAPNDLLKAALLFLPPIHMYRQLRDAYQLRWWSALLRTLLLMWAAIVVLGLFVLLLVALGVAG